MLAGWRKYEPVNDQSFTSYYFEIAINHLPRVNVGQTHAHFRSVKTSLSMILILVCLDVEYNLCFRQLAAFLEMEIQVSAYNKIRIIYMNAYQSYPPSNRGPRKAIRHFEMHI